MEHFWKHKGKLLFLVPTWSFQCWLRLRALLHLWLLEVQVLSVLDGEVDVLQDDVESLLVRAVEGQEPDHAVVLDLDRTTVTTRGLTGTLGRSPPHQTTDGLCQLLKLCAPDAVRVILYHGVHVRVQIPAGRQHHQNMENCRRPLHLHTHNSLFDLLLGFRVEQVHFGHDVNLRDL